MKLEPPEAEAVITALRNHASYLKGYAHISVTAEALERIAAFFLAEIGHMRHGLLASAIHVQNILREREERIDPHHVAADILHQLVF